MKRLNLQMVWLISVLFAASLHADHPNNARGLDVGKPYQMNGIDNINLFNGNLTIALPVGQRYHAQGNLAYGFSLVYSGNVWEAVDDEYVSCGALKRTYPHRRSNAGLGWTFSMGRLFPPNQSPMTQSIEWNYETPDGAVHPFYPSLHAITDETSATDSYTRDGTYIRMRTSSNGDVRTIELPDGTRQVFSRVEPVTAGPWVASTSPSAVWRLTQVKDRFENTLTVAYSAEAAAGSTPAYPEVWTISDSFRSHKVYFIAAPSAPYTILFDHADLAAFGAGAKSTWKAAYTYRNLIAGYPNTDCSGTVSWANVPLLLSLTGPVVNGVSQVYSMLDASGQPFYSLTGSSAFNGYLKGMRLPTKGWLEWDYEAFPFIPSSEEGISKPIAVTKRRMRKADQTLIGEWTYTRRRTEGPSCIDPVTTERKYARSEQLVVAVTSPAPENVTTVHYFSTSDAFFNPGACIASTTFFWDTDYSLPLTRGVSKVIDGIPHYLSSEVYSGTPSLVTAPNGNNTTETSSYLVTGGTRLRSEWVAYEYDTDWDGPGSASRNPREVARATLFEDETSCAQQQVKCYSSIRRYNFDGIGHFRQTSTGGNFDSGNFKTTFAAYKDLDLHGDWIHGTYTESCAAYDASARVVDASHPAISQCSQLSAALVSRACFEPTTGFLKRSRALELTMPGEHDVIADYVHDSAGNMTAESYYGGDRGRTASGPDLPATVPTGDDLCSLSLASPTYSLAHEYSNGSRSKTSYPGNGLVVLDATIDPNTGLPQTSKDVSGLPTTFVYDALGRTTQVTRPAEPPVAYTYDDTAITAKATQISANGGGTTAQRTMEVTSVFDAFGRVSEERRLTPGGTAVRRTDYTASGLTSQVSEWESTPAHYTVFGDFDAFGRAHTITSPDTKQTTINYHGARSVERTVSVGAIQASPVQPAQKTTEEIYDRLGRLIEVKEPDSISDTKYDYDVADRLRSVQMTAQGTTQPRTFNYDGRGFLTSEVHPENGLTSYLYDARGHVRSKFAGSSASSFDLRYAYDAAERMVQVSHPLNRSQDSGVELVKAFSFAAANAFPNYKMGKLETATRYNQTESGLITVTETYGYKDDAGRLTEKTTSVAGPSGLAQTFTQSYAYSDVGLPATINYPTCTACGGGAFAVSPTYENGLLKTIPGYASSITYDVSGAMTQIGHQDGISDVITLDPSKMPRPSEISFQSYDPCSPPTIASQQQQGQGGTLSLVVTAGGTGPFTYQWFKDGATDPMPGETGSTCCSGGFTSSAIYRASVINSCGKVDSAPFSVVVCGSPAISSQPQNASIVPNDPAAQPLSVTATGCAPFTYHWYRSSSYADTSNQVSTAQAFMPDLTASAQYWARVTDSSNASVNSAIATVTVCGAPTIPTGGQPQSATYTGVPIDLDVSPQGCSPFTYEWFQVGANNSLTKVGSSKTYRVQSITATTQYLVRVHNIGGIVDSSVATISLACSQVSISTQPQGADYHGSPITLSVGASGGCVPYTYQWYQGAGSSSPIPNSNTPSFPVPSYTGTTQYWVKVTDAGGGTASSNVVSVTCPLTASLQLLSAGPPANLKALAGNCGPFTYVWSKSEGTAGTFTQIQERIDDVYNVTPTITTSYRVHVIDAGQVGVDTNVIKLIVPLPAPGALAATMVSSTQVNVAWSASAGAHHYELLRRALGSWTTIPVTGTSYNDTSCLPNTTYVYRVRAVDALGGSASPYTADDLATTMTFASLQNNFIQASDVEQIRTAINAIRSAAGVSILSWAELFDQAGYTGLPSPVVGGYVQAAHILALRNAMDKALFAVNVARPPYADDLATPTVIKAIHITELRSRAQ